MNLHQHYQQFVATHPRRKQRIAGAEWEYIICGAGPETLLLLPGGFGVADTAFRYLQAFKAEYRVISVSYPTTITTVAGLVDGLATLLAHEQVAQAHVLGGSYSGMIAQSLVRRYPDLVATLILSHTGAPNSARTIWNRACCGLVRALPTRLLRAVLHGLNRGFLPGKSADQCFWRGYFAAMIATETRASVLNRLWVLADFDRNYRFTSGDLRAWAGRILIAEATHDGLIPARERAALQRLYPQAQCWVFPAGDHADTITQPEPQIALIRSFLAAGA